MKMTSIGNDTQLANHIYGSSGNLPSEENRAKADHKAGNKTSPGSDKVDISEEARSLSETKGVDKTDSSSQIELTEEEEWNQPFNVVRHHVEKKFSWALGALSQFITERRASCTFEDRAVSGAEARKRTREKSANADTGGG